MREFPKIETLKAILVKKKTTLAKKVTIREEGRNKGVKEVKNSSFMTDEQPN